MCSFPMHPPHVDEILREGDGLAVAADGDGAVEVGGRVAVLAVGDADHGAADLPAEWAGNCHIRDACCVARNVTNHSNVPTCQPNTL